LSLVIVSILYLLASEGFNKLAELGWRHVVMIRAVFGNDWPQGTGTQTVNMLYGEEAVGGHIARLDAELANSVVEEKTGAPNVTCGAGTHGQHMLARWFQFKGLVKGSHPVDFNKRHPQPLGNGLYGLSGDVAVAFLDVLEHFNQLVWLAAAPFQYLV
jgi:hypothetical protein